MSDPKATLQTKNHPLAPYKLFEKTFCNHCEDKEWCAQGERRLRCILALIADELARTRQLLQKRTQHLGW